MSASWYFYRLGTERGHHSNKTKLEFSRWHYDNFGLDLVVKTILNYILWLLIPSRLVEVEVVQQHTFFKTKAHVRVCTCYKILIVEGSIFLTSNRKITKVSHFSYEIA
jgi:hypothetical protein